MASLPVQACFFSNGECGTESSTHGKCDRIEGIIIEASNLHTHRPPSMWRMEVDFSFLCLGGQHIGQQELKLNTDKKEAFKANIKGWKGRVWHQSHGTGPDVRTVSFFLPFEICGRKKGYIMRSRSPTF